MLFIRIVNWNLMWATRRAQRTPILLERIVEHSPEMVCLTETDPAVVPSHGYSVSALGDYGYSSSDERRKVVLWSQHPWEAVIREGPASMPPVVSCQNVRQPRWVVWWSWGCASRGAGRM